MGKELFELKCLGKIGRQILFGWKWFLNFDMDPHIWKQILSQWGASVSMNTGCWNSGNLLEHNQYSNESDPFFVSTNTNVKECLLA